MRWNRGTRTNRSREKQKGVYMFEWGEESGFRVCKVLSVEARWRPSSHQTIKKRQKVTQRYTLVKVINICQLRCKETSHRSAAMLWNSYDLATAQHHHKTDPGLSFP